MTQDRMNNYSWCILGYRKAEQVYSAAQVNGGVVRAIKLVIQTSMKRTAEKLDMGGADL